MGTKLSLMGGGFFAPNYSTMRVILNCKGRVKQQGYREGLKRARALIESFIRESVTDDPEWDDLDEEQQDVVKAYLEVADEEDTLQKTLEFAQGAYVGKFSSMGAWAEDAFDSGLIGMDDLKAADAVDWEKVGDHFGYAYVMTDNGMVFRFD